MAPPISRRQSKKEKVIYRGVQLFLPRNKHESMAGSQASIGEQLGSDTTLDVDHLHYSGVNNSLTQRSIKVLAAKRGSENNASSNASNEWAGDELAEELASQASALSKDIATDNKETTELTIAWGTYCAGSPNCKFFALCLNVQGQKIKITQDTLWLKQRGYS